MKKTVMAASVAIGVSLLGSAAVTVMAQNIDGNLFHLSEIPAPMMIAEKGGEEKPCCKDKKKKNPDKNAAAAQGDQKGEKRPCPISGKDKEHKCGSGKCGDKR